MNGTLREQLEQAIGQGVDAVVTLVESKIHTARYGLLSNPAKCRFCWATPLEPGGHHGADCQFYRGPLDHKWIRKTWNGTFGGLDHWCSCGGWFRQGGIAGHGDGTHDAEPVCPNADQGVRQGE